MKSLKIGLIGLGTVGTGVTHILQKNASIVEQQVGCPIEIKKVCVRNLQRKRKVIIEGDALTTDVKEIINDPEIDIVVEVMGGVEQAKNIIESAFRQGKHVVTANKDLVSVHGRELFELAEQNQCHFLFEASVAGGIPILRPLQYAFTADKILKISGIINGSTNYILTRMEKEKLSLEDVVEDAKELGYLEADPSADLQGLDAARKCAILASIGFHREVTFSDVYVEGIEKITLEDMVYAKKLGYTIKLMAIAENSDKGISARVHPTLIPLSHPLAAVNYELNAVSVLGNMVGETMFYGSGAGSLPTGSAVVSDIVAIGKRIRQHSKPEPAYNFYEGKKILSIDEHRTPYYIRVLVNEDENAMSNIIRSLEYYGISVYSVNQWESIFEDQTLREYIFITDPCRDLDGRRALEEIEALPTTVRLANAIRIERGF